MKFLSRLKWRNIKIGRKYLLSVAVAALLFLSAGVIVYIQLGKAQDNLDEYEQEMLRTQEINQISVLMQNKDLEIANYIITKREEHLNRYEELMNEFNEVLNLLKESVPADQEDLFHLIQDNDEKMNEIFNGLQENSDDQYSDEYLVAVRNRADSVSRSTIEAIEIFTEQMNENQLETMDRTQTSMNRNTIILTITNSFAVFLGIIIILLVSRNISNHLKNVVHTTSEIANGNLTVDSLTYEGTDEIGQLSASINDMKEGIKNILQNVSSAANAVASSSSQLTHSANEVKEGSEQIATTMSDLASGAESQATSSSDLLKNMNDFVAAIEQSEEEGQKIANDSNIVRELTNDGVKLMNKSVEQMNQIDQIVSNAVHYVKGLDKQSAEISNLVSVVKNIAEQTNLLALNAAIEAARAGEYGQGFAVVADEVRALAEQVAESVSEITNIVSHIQSETGQVVESLTEGYEEVQEGTKQIERTGQNFTKIDHSVSDMVQKITSISENLKEIVENSTHINKLIEDIAAVSEQSAAGVEEAAASSEQTSGVMDEVSNHADELATLASHLNEEIAVFHLDNTHVTDEVTDDEQEYENSSSDDVNREQT